MLIADRFAADLQGAWRGLRTQPTFAVTAIAILALGIGSSTAIASFAQAVLLNGLPYPDEDRLVWLYEDNVAGGMSEVTTSYQTFLDWRSRTSAFESMATAYFPQTVVLAGDEPETLQASVVSPEYFSMTGARAIAGRLFGSGADQLPGAHAVAVISAELFERRFGGDRAALARPLILNGRAYEITGVMSPDHVNFPIPGDPADLWLPIMMGPELIHPRLLEDRMVRTLPVLAKLRAGVGIDSARAELDALSAEMALEHPLNSGGWSSHTQSLRERYLGTFRGPVIALTVGATLLLLIGCANVANLLLIRANERVPDLALRVALGASRARIVRHTVVESLLIAIAAGIVGVVGAAWFVRALPALVSLPLPPFVQPALGAGLVSVALGVALATGVIFGLIPAWLTASRDLAGIVGGVGKGTGISSGSRARRVLVVAEIATAVTLLIGAALMVRSVVELQRTPVGLDPSGLLTLTVNVTEELRDVEELRVLARQLVDSGNALPGVTGATIWSPHVPGASHYYTRVRAQDQPTTPDDELPLVRFHYVDGNALRELRLRVEAGRPIVPADRADSRTVALVSRSLADALWPGEIAVGKVMRRWNRDAWATVVGVVADARHSGRQGVTGTFVRDVYFAYDQEPQRSLVVLLRTDGDPAALTAPLRAAVQKEIPDLPVHDVQSLAERLTREEDTPRLAALLAAVYALAALGLSAVGLYGVLAYAVNRGKREIGLRVALGARPAQVLRQHVGSALRLALAGVALGSVAAFALTRLLSSFLYEVSTSDPLVFASVPAILIAVVTLASLIPARRALRVDPMIALRNE